MSLIICPKCGEKCRDYDLFCHKCGTACNAHAKMCDHNCDECEYDSPYGCGKPKELSNASFYPHKVVEKDDKLYLVEDADLRLRLGVVLLAIFPSGAFGIHDFYGRYYLRGFLHILLFIAGFFIPLVGGWITFLVSWALAIVEAILVMARVIKNDGSGFPLD